MRVPSVRPTPCSAASRSASFHVAAPRLPTPHRGFVKPETLGSTSRQARPTISRASWGRMFTTRRSHSVRRFATRRDERRHAGVIRHQPGHISARPAAVPCHGHGGKVSLLDPMHNAAMYPALPRFREMCEHILREGTIRNEFAARALRTETVSVIAGQGWA